MVYLTGDTHGSFKRIKKFCEEHNTNKDDILIILGDVGINNQSRYDIELKRYISKLPITLFCIHGNHENRASNISSYKKSTFFENDVLIEEEFPNIIFAIDGLIYNINDNNVLVIGGAYSVDKYYRIAYGYKWYNDEQPSEATKTFVEKQINMYNGNIDVILSHTCPLKYQPIEWFLDDLDQSTVDGSTEEWFDKIYDNVSNNLKKWYCGHYHGSKKIDKMQFMFEDYCEFLK